MTFLLAYANSFVRTEKILFDYLTTKKDTRLWIGSIEAILALGYIRFRTGAKFRLEKGFKISNDHSHPIRMFDYKFDIQSLKRRVMGGTSMDLLNFKTPLYFSHQVLSELRPENRETLIKIALESVHSLLNTYKKDIMACESLKSMGLILECQLAGKDMESVKPFLYINEEYEDSPLTQKDVQIWKENIDVLDRIGHLFRASYDDFQEGKNTESNLNEINELREQMRGKLEGYLMEIPKGH